MAPFFYSGSAKARVRVQCKQKKNYPPDTLTHASLNVFAHMETHKKQHGVVVVVWQDTRDWKGSSLLPFENSFFLRDGPASLFFDDVIFESTLMDRLTDQPSFHPQRVHTCA